jgi:cation diffusion facilitator CzcD-associated flavoprotein CzcO
MPAQKTEVNPISIGPRASGAADTDAAVVGVLSHTNMPEFKGLEKFKGKWYHTSRFPHAGVDFTAKRVAVVGTGATAVQAIPEIAQQARQLTVFQRTANYCVPARNGKVDPELVKARKADYDGIIKRLRESMFGLEHYFIPKSALEATAEERIWLLVGQLPRYVLRSNSQ